MVFQVASDLGHEGVVAKRLDAPYLPGRRVRTWLKRKTPE
jgi:ATP-dependent DNA ligase